MNDPIPQTCPDFVEHPHLINGRGCYTCQVALASEDQGTSEIAKSLLDAGIKNLFIEQTGGFCMCLYIYGETQTINICANGEGVGLEFLENGDFKKYENLSEDGVTTAEIVEIIKKNLHRIK